MLVFGDAARTVCPQDELARLLRDVARLQGDARGPDREALTGLFIDAAELAQGLVDVAFADSGEDDDGPDAEAATRMITGLARAICARRPGGRLPVGIGEALRGLSARPLPAEVACKRGEGYAFYALYPESFAEAARGMQRMTPLRVIGIRSIGLGLAAMVAAGAGAARPVSVRPVGPPFRRTLRLSAGFRARLLSSPGDFAVVDEGPGLSGSSIGAVLDALEEGGVARSRLHVFPSHSGGLGYAAKAEHRERWGAIPRHVVDFDSTVLRPAPPRKPLVDWFTDVTGPADRPLQDLSGGAWRALRYSDEASWPPANVWQERRKYLLTSRSGRWLLKFAGLGRYGQAKLRWAAPLAEAGFIPPVRGLRNGFLIEPWMDDAEALDERPAGRDDLLDHLAAYLGFRARHLAAGASDGAAVSALAQMLRHNACEGLEEVAGADLDRFCGQAASLEARVRRVATDNRLHRWEWLRRADGRLLKTDAIDHAAAHDLVGCQDIAWDLAGAVAEFDLADAETALLAAKVGRLSGHAVDPLLLRFMIPCYLAFQLGSASMAHDALADLPADAARMRREAARYRLRLRSELGRAL